VVGLFAEEIDKMEPFNLIIDYVFNGIQQAQFASIIAFLALLVSIFSAWNSSRALRVTNQRHTDIDLLVSAEKRTSLLGRLQTAKISSINAKKELNLTDSTINSLLNLNPQEKFLEQVDKTKISLVNEIESIEKIEKEIMEHYKVIEKMEGTNKPHDFEKLTPRTIALQNEAQARLDRAESLHSEVKNGYEFILKELLSKRSS